LSTSTTYGGELVGELRLGPFFVQGNASYQHSSVSVSSASAAAALASQYGNDGRLPSYPTLQGHLTAGVTLPDYHLQATVTANAAGQRRQFFSDATTNQTPGLLPSYATLDANIRTFEVRAGDWHVDVGVLCQNILNNHYSEPGYYGLNIPALGRVLMGTVTLTH